MQIILTMFQDYKISLSSCLIFLLILMPNISAAENLEWNIGNCTNVVNSTTITKSFQNLQLENSTALFNTYSCGLQVGYEPICSYNGQDTIPTNYVQTLSGTIGIDNDTAIFGRRSLHIKGGAGVTALACAISGTAITQTTYAIYRTNRQGAGGGDIYIETGAGSGNCGSTATSMFVISSTGNNVNWVVAGQDATCYDDDNGIEIGLKGNQSVLFTLNTSGTQRLTNFSDSSTSSVAPTISGAQLFKFWDANNALNVHDFDYLYSFNNTPTRNVSANFFYVTMNSTLTYNSVRVGYYDKVAGNHNYRLALSCNNGTSWNTGTANTNNTLISCLNSQTSNNFYIGMYIDDNSTLVYGLTATPTSLSVAPNITLTAVDYYDSSVINNFSVYIQQGNLNVVDSTTNGTIYVNNITTGYINMTVGSYQNGGYFNATYQNLFINDSTIQAKLWQSIIYLNASTIITNTPILSFSVGVNSSVIINNSNSSGGTMLKLKRGYYNFIGNNSAYLNAYLLQDIQPLTTYNLNLQFSSNLLTIRATNFLTGATINNFTIYLTRNSSTYSNNASTSINFLNFSLEAGDYNMVFRSFSFINMSVPITISSSNIFPNYTFVPYTTNSINFTIFDESLGKSPNPFLNLSVFVTLTGEYYATNITITNASYYMDLITPSEYRIVYSSAGYTQREYYFTLSNSSNNLIELYLLSVNNGTAVTYNVIDESGLNVENALVKLLRYYSDTNSYRLVAMAKTDYNGNAIIDTAFDSAFYQVIVTKNSFTTVSTPSKIYTLNPIIKLITRQSIFNSFDTIGTLYSQLTFNNNTNTFTYTYNNIRGFSLSSLLTIDYITPGGTNNLCYSPGSGISGTLLCVINISSTQGQYIANGYIDLNDGNGYYLTDTYQINSGIQNQAITKFGKSGLILSLIATATIATLGAFNPAVAIMFFVGALGIFTFLGFSGFNIGIFVSITILAGIIIYKLRT